MLEDTVGERLEIGGLTQPTAGFGLQATSAVPSGQIRAKNVQWHMQVPICTEIPGPSFLPWKKTLVLTSKCPQLQTSDLFVARTFSERCGS